MPCARSARTAQPWYVIPSNYKWFRDLAISTNLVDTLDEMRIQIPKPLVDLKIIRRLYHSAKNGEMSEEQLSDIPAKPTKSK